MHDHDGPHPHLDGDSGENGVFEVDATTLWRRMLVIQRIFGCYNSARMRAALDLGVDDGFVRTFSLRREYSCLQLQRLTFY